jgi:hypothetical protein
MTGSRSSSSDSPKTAKADANRIAPAIDSDCSGRAARIWRIELTDPRLLAYIFPGFLGAFGLGLGAGFVPLLAWQSLTALLQSALHWLRRLLQYSTWLPRAMQRALSLVHTTLHSSNFSTHLSTSAANTIIKPLERARSATQILRFMRESFQISSEPV